MTDIFSLRFWERLIFSAGFYGLFSWLSLFLLFIYAGWTIIKYRARNNSFIPFYGIACAQLLLFVLANGFWGIISCFMCLGHFSSDIAVGFAYVIFSLSIEMIVVAFLVTLVAIFTRSKSQLSTGLLACLWITIADILLLISSILIVILNTPSGL